MNQLAFKFKRQSRAANSQLFYGLSSRMGGHRREHRRYVNGKYHFTTSFILFEEFGIHNCKIELIEEYPCENLEQLFKKEGEYIKSIDCVKKVVAGRTDKEYREANKDKIKERKQKWYESNQDDIKEKQKEWYELNKDKIKEKNKEWYESHQDKMKQCKKD